MPEVYLSTTAECTVANIISNKKPSLIKSYTVAAAMVAFSVGSSSKDLNARWHETRDRATNPKCTIIRLIPIEVI